MSLPRLRADLADDQSVARVLRGALRHEVEVVPLSSPLESDGQHLLEVDVPGEGVVTLLADPVESANEGLGQALYIRPLKQSQTASLLALVERLDEHARSEEIVAEPWEDEALADSPEEALAEDDVVDLVEADFDEPSDQTIMQPRDAFAVRAPARFGYLESIMPAPLSSVPASEPDPPLSSLPPLGSPPPPVVEALLPVPSPPPKDTRSRDERLIGRTIAGKYLIETAIGAGTTATVFRAMHMGIKRPVAVKVLHEQKLTERQFVKRFEAEALSASKLEHPNVTRIFDFGQEPDGLLYLVMELHAGKTLDAIVAVEGKLAPRRAVDIASQACSALAFAHDEGVIHRDIKPENIMLVAHRDDDGEPCELVKVCDFGLAKLHNSDANRELTVAGMLAGSPAYMSPEQARGEKLDQRTDIYSLGVTLFEALTGALPHDAESLTELFIKIMLHPPRPLSALLPGVDPRLEQVVMQAISTDRAARPANARALRKALRALV